MRELVQQDRSEQENRGDRADDPGFDGFDAWQGLRQETRSQRPCHQYEDDQPARMDADLDPANAEEGDRPSEHDLNATPSGAGPLGRVPAGPTAAAARRAFVLPSCLVVMEVTSDFDG